MSSDSNQTTLATLDSLEGRLRKVEWYLSGSDDVAGTLQQVASQGQDNTVQARLARLENNLQKLSASSPEVNELVKLHATFPDLFHPSISDVPTTLSTTELYSIIGSCASSYPTTASQLSAIKDLPVPPAESSAALIGLLPRLAQIELLQDTQAREMSELRARSAEAIQRWYELGVLGESECWSEWEGRVMGVEMRVRREEGLKAKKVEEMGAYRP